MLETPENGGYEGQKSTKMPILCSGASPMVGLIHSFNKYGRPESLYDLFWSPVWVLYSELWLPNRYHRNPLPHPAAVASSRRTAAAELRLLHGYQRSVAAATYRRYLPPHLPPHPEPLLPNRYRTPNHYHRGRGYSFRPLMASRSLVSISSASSGLSSRTFFTPSRPWASLLSL